MKRYLVFAYEYYYPSGGVNDMIGAFETEKEALACADENKNRYDTWHIYDVEEGPCYDITLYD